MKWLTNASIRKLRFFEILFEVIHIILIAAIPSIIVGFRYGIFENIRATKMSGWVFLFILIILVVTLKALDRVVEKMSPIVKVGKHKGEISVWRNVCLAIKKLIFPVACIVVMFLFKDDVLLAFWTFIWCMISIIAGMILEQMILEPIRFIKGQDNEVAEQDFRQHRREVTSKSHKEKVDPES